MNRKKSGAKLYNVLFPVWMLVLFPAVWIVVLPGNFIIDSLVLFLGMRVLNISDKKTFYKKSIFKIFCFGLLSDLIGSAILFLFLALELVTRGDELYVTIPAVLLSAAMIFVFNYFVTFKAIPKEERLKLSLTFAVITAPYTFLIPTAWLY